MVATAFGIFLILLIYARRQDKNDAEKVCSMVWGVVCFGVMWYCLVWYGLVCGVM